MFSKTTVDANNLGPVVVFENNNTSTLRGFTLTHGVMDPYNPYIRGGGIVSTQAEPTVEDCIIINNEGDRGGGVAVIGGGVFRRCKIENNYAESRGGGICASPSSGKYCVFANTVIAKNESISGAGIYGSTILLNCSILKNIGGAVITDADINSIITNTIIYGNEGSPIASSFATVSYSNIEGEDAYPGEGNLAESPDFQDDGENYYRLSENSPCIDRGTTDVEVYMDIDGDNRPEGPGMDIGADEYMPVNQETPNKPPVAILSGPDTVKAGESATFDACESFDPEGETALFFQWDWDNDGSLEEETETCTASHAWENPGKMVIKVTVMDEKGATAIETMEIKVMPATSSVTLEATLGDCRRWWHKDYDLFLLDGEKGEKVTIRLAANPLGYYRGKKATVLFKDGIRGLRFKRKNNGVLPNAITAVLPKSGKYRIWVIEQPRWRGWRCWKKQNSFQGSYCLTVESSKNAARTLRATRWVE